MDTSSDSIFVKNIYTWDKNSAVILSYNIGPNAFHLPQALQLVCLEFASHTTPSGELLLLLFIIVHYTKYLKCLLTWTSSLFIYQFMYVNTFIQWSLNIMASVSIWRIVCRVVYYFLLMDMFQQCKLCYIYVINILFNGKTVCILFCLCACSLR